MCRTGAPNSPHHVHVQGLNARLRTILKTMNLLSPSALATKMHHGWAGHLIRLPFNSPARQLVALRDAAWWNTEKLKPINVRKLYFLHDTQCEWEYKLCKVHGANWKQLCKDRGVWKHLESPFICERFWELGRSAPCDSAQPSLDANFRANFHATLNAPKIRGTLKKVRVVVATSDDDIIDSCLGRKNLTGGKYMYSRLQQALYLVTGFCGTECTGPKSIFVKFPSSDNFAKTPARGTALLEVETCTEHRVKLCLGILLRAMWALLVPRLAMESARPFTFGGRDLKPLSI